MQILIGGVDFSAWYKPKSMRGTDKTGSGGSDFSFTLEIPTSVPSPEEEVIVWDSTAHRVKIWAGRIKRAKQKVLGANGPVIAYAYDVQAGGYVRDVIRQPPNSKVYLNVTSGFIFRDVASVLLPGFSLASVTTGGSTIAYLEARHEKLNTLFDRLAAIEGWTWWVDFNKTLHFELPSVTPAPFSLTDSNWAALAGLSLSVEPDTNNLANRLEMYYDGLYQDGTCNVFNASNAVTGNGTSWGSQVQAGATFQLNNGTNIAYTVQAVNSDTSLTLSSNYNEVTSTTAQSYEIAGIQKGAVVTDPVSIAAMKAITGDNGIYTEVISPPGVSITYQEAQDILSGLIKEKANPAVNITLKSDSVRIPGAIQAGMSLLIQLSAFSINTTLQITSLEKQDTGAQDTNGYPILEYTIKFQTTLYDLMAYLRQKHQEQTEQQAGGTLFIDYILDASEVIPVAEVVLLGANVNVAETVPVLETTAIDDTIGSGPFVWGPGPGPAGSQVGEWSRCWWG